VLAGLTSRLAAESNLAVDFTRDVRPILANNCFHCHGPDEGERKADLRLDVWKNVGDIHGAIAVVSPGKPAKSDLINRILSTDSDVRMPPPDSGKGLTSEQIDTLRKWVAQGAEYRQHWAFSPPQRPAVPPVKNRTWVRNPIDAFVLARLESEGFEPSPAAERDALLRRLSLDLVGLPPTLEELAGFEAEAGDVSLDHQIERLLASPHYGERWGRIWLDAARYADSDGFEKDKPRLVWMYRDWVINSFNQDMPYDKFIIDQIAGDLLPNPTQDDVVATGFLRNSVFNDEGGADPEQFRMEAMYDRMDAIGKGILGLTIQCAQCHTHKYDPLTQTEYYQMLSFLNNCDESQITAYTRRQQKEWQATEAIIHQMENDLRAENPDWQERMAAWEDSVRNDQPEWVVLHPKDEHSGDEKHYILDDDSILAVGFAPTWHWPKFSAEVKLPKITAIRVELLTDPNLPHGGPGRSIYGGCALTEFQLEASSLGQSTAPTKVKIASASADVDPPERHVAKMFDNHKNERRVTGPISFAIDGDLKTAWSLDIGPGRSNVPRKAVFVPDKPLEAADGIRLYLSLVQVHGGANVNDNQTNSIGRYRFSVTGAEKPIADPLPSDVRAIVSVPAAKRTPEQRDQVFSYWRTTVPEWQEENRRIEALWQSHPQGTSQLVLHEKAKHRETHRLERGSYLTPAEIMSPNVPQFLHSLDTGHATKTPTRLDFAHWLADRRSPTTARSIVNRIWQAYFGIGLVATTEDLGTQGEPPSHPELLDWLAVELMEHDWSIKHIQRLITSSATYQQSSVATPQLVARDPKNRLLARGPRYRVDAEIVRDIALSASGLINPKVGGPSVYPPAPSFLFVPPASYAEKTWLVDTGPNRYRRALYTFRFRSVLYPALQNFDAPIGDTACARRAQSNTPLQALTMLNEPMSLECARALVQRVLAETGNSDSQRIADVVRRCLARDPQPEEVDSLHKFLDRQKKRFTEEKIDPWPLVAGDEKSESVRKAKLPPGSTPAEVAAWTALARVVLSLDETITKE
jgi:mono/diheme cytochrome c family protein